VLLLSKTNLILEIMNLRQTDALDHNAGLIPCDRKGAPTEPNRRSRRTADRARPLIESNHGMPQSAPAIPPVRPRAAILGDMATDQSPLFCDRCSLELIPGKGNFYVVNIEAMADPSPPSIDDEDLKTDVRQDLRQLVQEMSELSQQELLDQVYRRMTLYLCLRCYTDWIENPTG
jgi:hypothetical protein